MDIGIITGMFIKLVHGIMHCYIGPNILQRSQNYVSQLQLANVAYTR